MIQILLDSPLLLLFVVAAIGYPLGKISIGGGSLGVAAVLFVGLLFGSLHPDLKLPDLIYELGLVVFVYTVGVSSGRLFFASFQRKGLRDNGFVGGLLIAAAALCAAAGSAFGLSGPLTAGLFTGSLTNTAALAGLLDYVEGNVPAGAVDQALAEPVVGFSIAYPMGVIGTIVTALLLKRIWKINYAKEAQRAGAPSGANRRLENRTIEVIRPEGINSTVQELIARYGWDIVFGRMKRGERIAIATGSTRLEEGDLVSLVGPLEDLAEATAYLGRVSHERLDLDRSEFDYRRVFVSNPAVAGHRVRDLHLPQQYGAFVTRVRRGDVEMLAHGDTVLELGDRVRVIARREDMDAIGDFFGDSYRALSEIDILTFNLGLALGLLVGMIPIPLPGGVVIRLGFAGGPLIVSLILGALERTGPLVWNLPYSANLTLRQIGLILFLAGIGTRSGYAFASMLAQGGGLSIFVAGVLITVAVTLLALWIGYRVLKIPFGLLLGMLAGLQTQPAVLGFALEQTGNDQPNIGYAAVYPVALIGKIVLAQLLVVLLG